MLLNGIEARNMAFHDATSTGRKKELSLQTTGLGPRGPLTNEALDQFPAGAAESFRTAEFGSISFDEGGIEVVLPDEETELVLQPRLPVARAVLGGKPFDGSELREGVGDTLRTPNSSTEQMPIP